MTLPRHLLVALTCVVLAGTLAGCGRKGRLDLPPQAGPDAVASPTVLDDDDQAAVTTAPPSTPQQAVAQRRQRRIILDPILD